MRSTSTTDSSCGMCVVGMLCSGKWSRREELQRRGGVSRSVRLRSPQRSASSTTASVATSQHEDVSKTPCAPESAQLNSIGGGLHSIDVPDSEVSYQPRFAKRNARSSFPTLHIPPHLARVKLPTSTEPEISEVEPHSTSGTERSSLTPDSQAIHDPLLRQRSQTELSPEFTIDHHLRSSEIQHTHSSSFSFSPPSNIPPQTCTLLHIISLLLT